MFLAGDPKKRLQNIIKEAIGRRFEKMKRHEQFAGADLLRLPHQDCQLPFPGESWHLLPFAQPQDSFPWMKNGSGIQAFNLGMPDPGEFLAEMGIGHKLAAGKKIPSSPYIEAD